MDKESRKSGNQEKYRRLPQGLPHQFAAIKIFAASKDSGR